MEVSQLPNVMGNCILANYTFPNHDPSYIINFVFTGTTAFPLAEERSCDHGRMFSGRRSRRSECRRGGRVGYPLGGGSRLPRCSPEKGWRYSFLGGQI